MTAPVVLPGSTAEDEDEEDASGTVSEGVSVEDGASVDGESVC